MAELKLKNYMEDVVKYQLQTILNDRDDICKCEHCQLDIMALALNELQPKYIVTDKGEVYSKIDSLMLQSSTDVTTAITKGIEKVKNAPRHK